MKNRFTKGNSYGIRVSKRVLNPETFSIHNRDIQRDHRFCLIMQMMRDNKTLAEMGKVLKIQPASVGLWMSKYGMTGTPVFKKWSGNKGVRIKKGRDNGKTISELRQWAQLAIELSESTNKEIMQSIANGNKNVTALRKRLAGFQGDYARILDGIKELTA